MLIIKIVNSDHISYLGAPLLIEHGQWRPVSRSRLLIEIGGYVEINEPVSSSVDKITNVVLLASLSITALTACYFCIDRMALQS